MWLKWRVMLGIGIVPPAIIVMCLTFLPESPRWLISRGRIREGYKVSERTKQLSPYPAEVRMSQYAASLRYLDGIWCVRAACVNLRVWCAAAFTLCAAWLDTEPEPCCPTGDGSPNPHLNRCSDPPVLPFFW